MYKNIAIGLIKQWVYKLKVYTKLLFSKSKKLDFDIEIIIVCETNIPRLKRFIENTNIDLTKMALISLQDKFNTLYNHNRQAKTILAKNPEDVVAVVRSMPNAKILHCFESRSLMAYAALKAKYKKTKFIFDFQDLYFNYTENNSIPNWMRANLPFEKTVIKKSDILISYSLELQTYKRANRIKKNCKRVYFPFYLEDKAILKPKEKNTSDIINIVYAGGIAPLSSNISFNMRFTEEVFRDSNVILHIYPSPTIDKTTIKEYEEYSLFHPNFKIHAPVSNSLLSKELSQYDAGIVPFFKTMENMSTNKFKYSTALKLWNYIEAGIPIICSSSVQYQSWLVKRYNLGLTFSDSEFKNLAMLINQLSFSQLSLNIAKVQQDFLLSKNIWKIDSIYTDLLHNN